MSNNERKLMLKYMSTTHGINDKALKKMTIPKMFKQFFTPQKYSQIMINQLKIEAPKKIIDLSMGEASLLLEGIERWPDSEYYGNDIDKKCCEKICLEYPKITCFNFDIFKRGTIQKIENFTGKIDLCIGNPPFHLIKQSKDIKAILKSYKLDKIYNSEKIPAEVIFILQCLNILSDNGTLSLILPDGFFVNNYLSAFRKFLINNYEIISIMELHNNIFEKTDAKTHILTLKKIKSSNAKIELLKHGIFNRLYITSEQAILRMDYSFYENRKKYVKYLPISKFNIKFMRGKPKYLIKNIKSEYVLHTTNFSKGNIFKNELKNEKQLVNYKEKIAKTGDIIIARVGSSCIGKIGYVEKGFFVATDCIFILSISDIKLRKEIFNMLSSKEGQRWIQSNSKGVSAKHITLEDFKKFPYLI